MPTRKNAPLNTAILCKKYKCDVKHLIRLWKKGLSDFEISQALGIDILKIMQVRQEILCFYERERQQTGRFKAQTKSLFSHNPR